VKGNEFGTVAANHFHSSAVRQCWTGRLRTRHCLHPLHFIADCWWRIDRRKWRHLPCVPAARSKQAVVEVFLLSA